MGALITRSTLLHLRFPFSIFLLPIFLFALAISPNINPQRMLIVFVCLHFLIYPASNGFNSFYDRDEESIGGLKNPPKVSPDLLWISLILDLVAILLALKISFSFAIMLFIYGLISKAYSHPTIRLKKFPITSWLVAGFFQGAFTFAASYIGLNNFQLSTLWQPEVIIAAFLTSLHLWASYPMTQIYQHEEDARRGDMTLSRLLGLRGTFIFTAIIYIIATVSFIIFFSYFYYDRYAVSFLIALAPSVIFFSLWLSLWLRGNWEVNYKNTMVLNWLSSIGLTAFFIYFFLDYSQVIQAIQGGF